MSKGRRRRGPRRRGRERRAEQPREQLPEEGVSARAAGVRPERTRGGEDPVPAAAADGRRGRAEGKQAGRGGGLKERVGRVHVSPWLIATPIIATVVVILAVLILS